MNQRPPRNWCEVLEGISTETFGMYSEETARVAIECCMNALEEYEHSLPGDQIDRVSVYGISDAESIQIASTDAVNDALTLHHQRTTVGTTIRLVDAIAKEVARLMDEKRTPKTA